MRAGRPSVRWIVVVEGECWTARASARLRYRTISSSLLAKGHRRDSIPNKPTAGPQLKSTIQSHISSEEFCSFSHTRGET